MSTDAQPTELPLLAIVYGRLHLEQPLRRLAEAAEGVCRILWVLYSGDPKSRTAVRLVRGEGGISGDVVNVAGLSVEEAADKIRPYAPDGITCYIDESVVWTAAVAEALGLQYNSPATATRLTDKLEQRRALRAYGLPTPQFWDADDLTDPAVLASVVEQAGFPLVIKPRRGVSSQNVAALHSVDELRDAVAAARPGTMLVETYIPDPTARVVPPWLAPYVSVEVLGSRGRLAAVGVTGRTLLGDRFKETGMIFPAALPRAMRDAFVEAGLGAGNAVGAGLGYLHVEVKWTDDGPVVIEVNGRLGGGRLSEFLGRAFDADPIRVAMRVALGEDVTFDDPLDAPSDVGFLFVVHAPAHVHRLTGVEGAEAVAAMPGVVEVRRLLEPGADVDPGLGTLGAVLEVHGYAPDHEAARRVHDEALATLVVSGTQEA